MSYQKYGVDPLLVERVKKKLKNPVLSDRVKLLLEDVTKYDLQDRVKVGKLLARGAGIVNEKITAQQSENIIQFVLAQKIDPSSKLHLLKLWSTFR